MVTDPSFDVFYSFLHFSTEMYHSFQRNSCAESGHDWLVVDADLHSSSLGIGEWDLDPGLECGLGIREQGLDLIGVHVMVDVSFFYGVYVDQEFAPVQGDVHPFDCVAFCYLLETDVVVSETEGVRGTCTSHCCYYILWNIKQIFTQKRTEQALFHC